MVYNTDRLRSLTKRGRAAFSYEKNLADLRSELIEMALAIDELLAGKGTFEAAALEGNDVLFLLDRFAHLAGFELWEQCQRIKFAKAEAKISEMESARESHG
jgi:hypothetical protein